jgi:hypothetical protein
MPKHPQNARGHSTSAHPAQPIRQDLGERTAVNDDSEINAALQAAGVDPTRESFTIDPPTMYGGDLTSGYADDPVNTATGNFVESEADLEFGGGSAGLDLVRMYNSFNKSIGAFGPGWSSLADSKLEISDDQARWTREDGRVVVFPREQNGWGRSLAATFWLEPDGGGPGWVISDNSGGFRGTHTFRATSRWSQTRTGLVRTPGFMIRVAG